MRKRTVRILTVLAAIIVLLGIIYAIAVVHSTRQLRRAYAALQADGRPMDRGEVIPPHVEDVDNAALLYQCAISMLKAEPIGQPPESPPAESVQEMIVREKCKDLLGYLSNRCAELLDDKITPENRREMEELMSRKAVDYALFAIETGTQRPACQFRRDYEAGEDLVLPELSDMKHLARILAGRVRLEAQAGATDRAWQLVATQARLADALRSEPVLISQLVRMAVAGLSCATTQNLCETAPPSQEQQANLDMILRGFEDVTPLVRAMDGERLLFGEWLFTRPRKELPKAWQVFGVDGDELPGFVNWLIVRRITFKPAFLADRAKYLRIVHANAKRLEGPYSPETAEELNFGRFSLTAMLAPGSARIQVIHCRMVANIRITRAGLGLLRYHQTHETFPATLDALKMDGLTDPFTQEPLRYRTEGDGFIIYSVGEDLKDNGGIPRSERRSSEPGRKQRQEYDIVWRFPQRMPQDTE
jgi:hypothetical protein